MWTIINLVANLSTTFQVVFLFSCGQDYMRTASKRGGRSFEITRLCYTFIAITSICCALLYTKVPQPTEVVANFAVALLLSTKSYSAWKYHVRAKIMKHRKMIHHAT